MAPKWPAPPSDGPPATYARQGSPTTGEWSAGVAKFEVILDQEPADDRRVVVDAESFSAGEHWVVFLGGYQRTSSGLAAFPTTRVISVRRLEEPGAGS